MSISWRAAEWTLACEWLLVLQPADRPRISVSMFVDLQQRALGEGLQTERPKAGLPQEPSTLR